jgi:hypothetical protein
MTPFATTDGDEEKYPPTFIPRKKGREGSEKVRIYFVVLPEHMLHGQHGYLYEVSWQQQG